MKRLASITATLALTLLPFTAQAQDYASLIDEDFLRTTFPFAEGESMKHADCEVKTVFTCTYIWGVPSDKDAARASLGLAPDGHRVMVMFAETNGMAAWPRATQTYPDGQDIAGLGQAAMWSAARGQISVMTAENLLFHVNVEDFPQETATAVAAHILEGL